MEVAPLVPPYIESLRRSLQQGQHQAGLRHLASAGIHHGPHPKALANQQRKSQTDQYAVMLDGLNPIHVLPAGEQVEWKEYWASWMVPVGTTP